MSEQRQQADVLEEIDVGDAFVSWETWEFPPHHRGTLWYVIAGSIALLLIAFAVLSANYLFAIIILMIGVIFLINNLRKPERVMVHITNLGVVIGEEFFRYREIKDFAVVYDPPDVQLLYLDFHRFTHPLVALPLENVNPNMVREALLPYVLEDLDREEERLTDTIRRVYKL